MRTCRRWDVEVHFLVGVDFQIRFDLLMQKGQLATSNAKIKTIYTVSQKNVAPLNWL